MNRHWLHQNGLDEPTVRWGLVIIHMAAGVGMFNLVVGIRDGLPVNLAAGCACLAVLAFEVWFVSRLRRAVLRARAADVTTAVRTHSFLAFLHRDMPGAYRFAVARMSESGQYVGIVFVSAPYPSEQAALRARDRYLDALIGSQAE